MYETCGARKICIDLGGPAMAAGALISEMGPFLLRFKRFLDLLSRRIR